MKKYKDRNIKRIIAPHFFISNMSIPTHLVANIGSYRVKKSIRSNDKLTRFHFYTLLLMFLLFYVLFFLWEVLMKNFSNALSCVLCSFLNSSFFIMMLILKHSATICFKHVHYLIYNYTTLWIWMTDTC